VGRGGHSGCVYSKAILLNALSRVLLAVMIFVVLIVRIAKGGDSPHDPPGLYARVCGMLVVGYRNRLKHLLEIGVFLKLNNLWTVDV